MTARFNPGVNPSYDYQTTRVFPHHEYEFAKPYVARRPLALRPMRLLRARYRGMTRTQRDYTVRFFEALGGPVGEFLWPTPDALEAPEDAGPAASTTAGGSLALRVYYLRYTWYDATSSSETTASPTVSITVDPAYLVSLAVPVFPSGVPSWRVYAGTSAGSEWLQGSTTARTWTEPVTGLVPTTSLPPTENTLRPDVLVALADPLTVTKTGPGRYTIDLSMREQFAQ